MRRAVNAALLGVLAGACALTACAPARHRISGDEAAAAVAFFRRAGSVPYPVVASFSGYAEVSGRIVPFVAGVRARAPSEEVVGVYDPQGRSVMFLENDGGRVTVARGPAAGEFPPARMEPIDAGAVSLGRIVSGGPGYPVSGGEAAKTGEGAWVLEDGRQTLFSDPGRTLLARAEYAVAGRRITVTYPGRESAAPPRAVEVELPGARILLRRDSEE